MGMTEEISTPPIRRTERLYVDPAAPDAEVIQRAAEVLRAGGLVAFPTETVYGLGANALDPVAVAGIYAAKGRPGNNPLIVHVADTEEARRLVTEWPERAELLAARFWPGPLTLVLPRRPEVPDIITGGGATVGIRVPAHSVAHALLLAAGVPVAAPSANRSNRISPTRATHVYTDLDGRIDMILDGGPTSGGLESTVLDLTTKRPTLLRPGLIAPGEIEAIVGPIKRSVSVSQVVSDAALPAPGMMERHYAPRAPLEIAAIAADRVTELLRQGVRVGWLTTLPEQSPQRTVARQLWQQLASQSQAYGVMPVIITMPREPDAYAAELYAALHALDAAGVARIIVDRPPELESWLAIRDRLRRAAAPIATGT
jgi:L-threonylcarbamoyladenylate synthase